MVLETLPLDPHLEVLIHGSTVVNLKKIQEEGNMFRIWEVEEMLFQVHTYRNYSWIHEGSQGEVGKNKKCYNGLVGGHPRITLNVVLAARK